MGEPQKQLLFAQCKAYYPLENLIKQCEKLIHEHTATCSHIYISAPYLAVEPISKKFNSTNITIGAEKMLPVDDHAFTVTIAEKMLLQLDAKFVLIGTTEERQLCQSKNYSLKSRLKSALKMGITPFICISETWQEHEDGLSN